MRKKILNLMVVFCLVISTVFSMGTLVTYALQSERSVKQLTEDEKAMIDEAFVPFSELVSVTVSENGYINYDFEIEEGIVEPDAEEYKSANKSNTIPSAYMSVDELREKYPWTRDQSPYGTCQAFAVAAAAEFDMITDGDAEKEIDLSELQAAYFVFHDAKDHFGNLNGDDIELGKFLWNDKNWLDFGANDYMYMYTLAQYKGFSTEEYIPYSWADPDLVLESVCAYDHNNVVLDQVRIYSIKENPDAVKQAIKQNGAVSSAYYHNESFYDTCSYKGEEQGVYYYNNPEYEGRTNHAVAIVGWDDDFPRDCFPKGENGEGPANDGAWLIRNSWSSIEEDEYKWCNYFWMSYEDVCIRDDIFAMDFVEQTNYNIYQHDGCLTRGAYPAVSAANVFKVEDTGALYQELESVALTFTYFEDLKYEIEIYTDLTNETDPTSGILEKEATTEGLIEETGHYTIKLENPVRLEPGEKYSIVVNVLSGNENGSAMFDVESSDEREDSFIGMKWKTVAHADPGESFVKVPYIVGKDAYWCDLALSDMGNLSIKGLTKDIEYPDGLVLNNPIKNGNDVTFDCVWFGEYYQSNGETKEPIKWRILSVEDDKALLIADKNLDNQPFNTSTSNGWNKSSLKEWLNNDFIDLAFTSKEQAAITDNPQISEQNGIFILSPDEYSDFNFKDNVWKSSNTEYVNDKLKENNFTSSKTGWWLRKTYSGGNAWYVEPDGADSITLKTKKEINVRPCLYLDLDHMDSWSYAGTVSSDGTEICVPPPIKNLSAPTNVKISNVASSGKPKITWDKVEGADKYYVYRSTTKDGNYSYLRASTTTSYVDTSAVGGKVYYYKVRAVYSANENANSAQSGYVYERCDLAQPTGLKIGTVTSSGKLQITWNAVEGADRYYVYRSDTKNGTYSYLRASTTNSYVDNSAVGGKVYYYKVRAVYSANENANSTQSGYVYERCDLTQPTGLKIGTVTSSGKLQITWNVIEGADKYYVYRSDTKNGTYSYLRASTTNSYVDNSAVGGKVYYYKVRAVYSANENANSAQSSYVYERCKLSQPTGLKISNVSSEGKLQISWNVVEGADKYYVYRSDAKNGTYTYLRASNSTSYVDSTTEVGKLYYYKVRAVYSANENANSAQSSYVYDRCKSV